MDLKTAQKNIREIPHLRDICMDRVAAGFGDNEHQCKHNAIQNLAILHKIHREGRYKQYPYGIGSDEFKKVENQIFPDQENSGYTKTYAKKVYPNIVTPFLVKNNNYTFYIQDNNIADLALFNIKTGEKDTLHLKNKSAIRCCTKDKLSHDVYIGTHNGTVNKINGTIHQYYFNPQDPSAAIQEEKHTPTQQVFHDPNNSSINSLAVENDCICASVMNEHTYLIDLGKNKKWIQEDYTHNLLEEKKNKAISKAVKDYKWNFFCPIENGKITYEVRTKGNEEWLYNKILIPFNLEDEKVSDPHPYPYISWNSEYTHSFIIHNNITYTGSSCGDISLCNIHSANSIDIPKAHNGRISCLIVSKHNDNIFYSGSTDGTIKEWDLRKITANVDSEDKIKIRSTKPQKNGISCIYESNDGKKMYAGNADGILIWDDINDPQSNLHKICSAYGIINKEIKKINLQYVDCITANDNESEIYIANIPTGITVLSPTGIEEFAEEFAHI
jgi:WD40 repeat protein